MKDVVDDIRKNDPEERFLFGKWRPRQLARRTVFSNREIAMRQLCGIEIKCITVKSVVRVEVSKHLVLGRPQFEQELLSIVACLKEFKGMPW